ncbi:uncharacterized protein [Dermacentor albipictus]|uniref:uncharacterized protein isoform X2 n=1 Tax=Dermacentor albipictus TaxID=60249 RepID=UPI0031FC04C7
MKQVITAVFFLSAFLFTAPAYKLPESEFTVEATFGNISSEAAEEAVLVGYILRIAASELVQDDAQDYEEDADECFFKSLWEEIVAAIKKAARVIWDFLKELAEIVKEAIKEVALAVV